ncbi:metallophosphoesterase family protein [Candidatus Nanosalina sp. VS9-1]|uniref:metallophosphoesterase family protein n=1 Tax=Candidatus Nanosalina sp. VS9-1 TaxID=3388566 RepID=UPI0039E041C7
MKILVVGDCHGKKPEIEGLAEEASVILVTGDVCGDSDTMRNAMFDSIDSQKKWYDVLGRETAREAVEKSLEEGRQVLEYLNSFDKPVFLVPGNWDWIGDEAWDFLGENHFQKLVDEFNNIHNINGEIFQDSEYSYIGYGPCPGPEIPQYEDDRPEDEQEMKEIRKEYTEQKERLEKLFQASEKPVIFLSHNVPHNTSLDRIENPDSPADGRHYGSIIVRELIEEKNPVLSIAGHMHEGYGKEKIGGTVAVNAGLNRHVVIDLENEKVGNLDFC